MRIDGHLALSPLTREWLLFRCRCAPAPGPADHRRGGCPRASETVRSGWTAAVGIDDALDDFIEPRIRDLDVALGVVALYVVLDFEEGGLREKGE